MIRILSFARVGAVVTLALSVPLALGMPANVAGINIELPIPSGMCGVGTTHPVDNEMRAQVVALVSPANEVLALFASCPELTKHRQGTDLLIYCAIPVNICGRLLRKPPRPST